MTKEIGTILKRIRIESGLKQNFVAKKASISNRYLSAIESGNKKPTLKTLEKIAGVLGKTLPKVILEYIMDNGPVDKDKTEDFNSIINAILGILEPAEN